MKILALMPDAYGGKYGIAQYNRDLLDALVAWPAVERIVSLSRLAVGAGHALPPKIEEVPLAGSPLIYLRSALRAAVSLRPDLVLCGHMNLLPVAVLAKMRVGAPILLEIYGVEAWEAAGDVRPRIIGNPAVRRWAVGNVDRVAAISRYTRDRFIGWTRFPAERTVILNNAVHLEAYGAGRKPEYLVKRYGLEGRRVLMTLGNMDYRYKGQDRIILILRKLLERYPDLVYVVGGGGRFRGNFATLAEFCGVRDRVIFTGVVADGEKIDHYRLADAFAMPSTGEGFGFVFLEAAACGLPVLGGGVDGSRDALRDGALGVMVDPDDREALLDGLTRILGMPQRVPELLGDFSFEAFSRRARAAVDGCTRGRNGGCERVTALASTTGAVHET